MPVTHPGRRHGGALVDRPDPGPGHRPAEPSPFHRGPGRQEGRTALHARRRPFQAALQQAQAVLARDTAHGKNAQAQQARATRTCSSAGLIPRDQYETQSASAAALAATLAADQAAVENARLNLQYTRDHGADLRTHGRANVHVGDLVRANDTTPLVVINQLVADLRDVLGARPVPRPTSGSTRRRSRSRVEARGSARRRCPAPQAPPPARQPGTRSRSRLARRATAPRRRRRRSSSGRVSVHRQRRRSPRPARSS